MFDRIKKAINKKAFTMIFARFMIFVVVFVAFNFMITSIMTRKIKDNITESYALTLNSVSNTVNQSVQQFMTTSNLLYLCPEVFELFYDSSTDTGKDASKVMEINDALVKYKNISSVITNIAIIDRESSRVYTSGGNSNIYTFFNFSNVYEDYPMEFWQGKELSLYGYQTLAPTTKKGKSIIPVIVGGQFSGESSKFILIDIDCQRLMKTILENVTDEENLQSPNIYIYNRENNVVIGKNPDDFGLTMFKNKGFIKRLEKKTSFLYKFGGVEYLIVKSVGTKGVMDSYEYISIVPIRNLMEDLSEMRILLTIGSLIVGFLLLLMAFHSTTVVYRPIDTLKRQVLRTSLERDKENDNEVDFIISGVRDIVNKSIDMSQELENVLPLASQHYLIRFLETDNDEMSDSLERYLHRGGVEFNEDGFVVATVRFRFTEKFYDDFTKDSYQVLSKSLEDFFGGLFAQTYESVVVSRRQDSLVLIVNIPDNDKDFEKVTLVLGESVRAFDNDREHLIVKVAVSGRHNGFEGMRKAYRESKNTGTMQISSYENEINICQRTEDTDARLVYSIDDDNHIYHCIIKGDMSEAESVVEKLVQRNVESGVSGMQIKQLYRNIYSTIKKALTTKKVSEQVLMQENYKDADVFFDISDIEDWIAYVEMVLREAVRYTNLSSTGLDIEGVTAYVEENYMKDIYLESVAEQFGTTAKYLSKIFKQHTGVNFADYVVGIRIEAAKRMIIETDKKVNDIYVECGFYSRNTFIRNFKNRVGVLPSEYRKMAKHGIK